MQIVSEFRPDYLIAGSDSLDFYSISTFDKDPLRKKGLSIQEEIDAWSKTQSAWSQAAPGAKRHFLIGNHEDRLRRYLWKNPELAELDALSLPALLDFPCHGIEPGAHDEVIFGEHLAVKHGSYVRKYAGYSAQAELEAERYQISVQSGHTHRAGAARVTTRNGVVFGNECYCLCDLNPAYVKNPNWQQGIVMTEIEPDGRLNIHSVDFFRRDKRLFGKFNGKLFVS